MVCKILIRFEFGDKLSFWNFLIESVNTKYDDAEATTFSFRNKTGLTSLIMHLAYQFQQSIVHRNCIRPPATQKPVDSYRFHELLNAGGEDTNVPPL